MAVRASDIIQSINVQSSGLERLRDAFGKIGTDGQQAFDKLSGSANKAAPAIDKTEQEVKELDNGLDRLTSGLARVAAALGVAFGAREIIQTADSFVEMENKINSATDSAEEFESVMAGLRRVSNETRTDVTDNAQAFVRFNLVMGDLGKSSDETLRMIETLNKSLAVSGVSTQEAQAGIRQLSQAFGSGRLQGDEFRSIMENLPPVARAIADEMGKTTGELKELSSQGVITSDVMANALATLAADADRDFAEINKTVSSSLIVLRNEFGFWINDINKTIEGTSILASGILFLADNFEILSSVLSGVATALTIAFGPTMLAMVLLFFNTIRRHPFVMLASALVSAVSYLVQMRDEWKAVDVVLTAVGATISRIIGWISSAISAASKLASALGSVMGKSEGGPAFQGGGRVWGEGTSTSDSIWARLSRGEYVIRAAAVDHYGQQLFDMLNRMMIPRLASGGMAEATVAPAQGSNLHPLTLQIGGELFDGLLAPERTANQLIRFSINKQIKSAGRKPGWYR